MFFFFLFLGRLVVSLGFFLLASAVRRLMTHPFGFVSSVTFAPVEILSVYDLFVRLALLGTLEGPGLLLAGLAFALALVLVTPTTSASGGLLDVLSELFDLGLQRDNVGWLALS